MQAEFFRVLTVSVDRARRLMNERSKWRLNPHQQDWLRIQNWQTVITELDIFEQPPFLARQWGQHHPTMLRHQPLRQAHNQVRSPAEHQPQMAKQFGRPNRSDCAGPKQKGDALHKHGDINPRERTPDTIGKRHATQIAQCQYNDGRFRAGERARPLPPHETSERKDGWKSTRIDERPGNRHSREQNGVGTGGTEFAAK